MTRLTWDKVGERLYETGVDRGVLYIPDNAGVYSDGVAWNGLTTVTESPSGADATALYADNIKYLNLISVEEFGATIEAYTYPDAFAQFDGVSQPVAGINVGQQTRKAFGLSYRTRVGNDVSGADFGYKLHLIYGATAAPSEKAYGTINDSPDAIAFSWQLTTTPVDAGTGLKPTALLTIDSTKVSATALATLEDILYGTAGQNPRLPLPTEVVALFGGTVTTVTPTIPTFNATTGVITIPTVTGVEYRRDDTDAVVTGTVTITGPSGSSLIIRAVPKSGYVFPAGTDVDWQFTKA